MPQIRLYVDLPFEKGSPLPLQEEQGHYLMHVMRLGEGDQIHVFNGRDGEWLATFMPHKKRSHIVLESQVKPQKESPWPSLVFSPIKPKRLEFLIEKATELGGQDFYPTLMDHTSFGRIKGDKIESYAIEAAEQSERLDVPTIHDMEKLSALLKNWDPSRPIIWAVERGDYPPLKSVIENLQNQNPPTFLIGPEGGFSPKEIEMLKAINYVHPVSLGESILRAETAALLCLSAFQIWNAKQNALQI